MILHDKSAYERAIEARKPTLPEKTHDYLVFIGRFQPFHFGHYAVIEQALRQATTVVVLVGSANAARCYRNPFDFEERRKMILDSFPDYTNRIAVVPLEDRTYNETRWIADVQSKVNHVVQTTHDFSTDPKIGLIGHSKDNTSYYLKLFPQWSSVNVANYLDYAATTMREGIFSNICDAWLAGSGEYVPENVRKFLTAFAGNSIYAELRGEYEFIRDYRKKWASLEYEPTFTTTDAVVIQAGHVLNIRRGRRPGKGLRALPGGFLKPSLTLIDNMVTELREETKIKVTDAVILRAASRFEPRVFDDPHRDPRGRFVTHAYLVPLEPVGDDFRLPEVVGSDDAASAEWTPLSQVRRDEWFADHPDIIDSMTAML